MSLRLFGVLVPVLLAGCFPSFEDPPECVSNTDCTSGKLCQAQRCVAPDGGAVQDAGPLSDAGNRDGSMTRDAGTPDALPSNDAAAADGAEDASIASPDAEPAPDAAEPDAAQPDLGFAPDASEPDVGVDSGAPDDAMIPDAGSSLDVGFAPDATPPDVGFAPDASPPDVGFAPDAEPLDTGPAPQAVNDTIAAIQEETARALNLLANDTGANIAVVAHTNPARGNVSANATTYTSTGCVAGPDSFSYTIRDSSGREASASVSLTIVDATAPAALAAPTPIANAVTNHVSLRLVAPGENGPGSSCRSSAYNLAIANNPQMTSAVTSTLAGAPATPGTVETRDITAAWGALHYMQVTTRDERGNRSSPHAAIAVDLRRSSGLSPAGTSYSFGAQRLGVAVTQTFRVTNTSALVPLSITSVARSGSAEFSITAGNTGLPLSIAPGGTHDVTVRYLGTQVGAQAGTLTIAHNGTQPSAGPYTVALSATGDIGPPVDPVLSNAAATPRLVRAGTSVTVGVTVTDANSGLPGYDDIAGVEADTSAFPGGSGSVMMTPGSPSSPTARPYSLTLSTTGLLSGAYSVPITVTDAAGNVVTDAIVVAVYTGTLRTAGAGQTHATIQAAINAAASGDGVQIAPGTYLGAGNVNLVFGANRQVVVASSGGPEVTTIDCNNSGRAFNLISTGQTVRSAIVGLTIRGCVAGGAIRLESVSPTLGDLVLADNVPGAISTGSLFLNGTADVVAHRIRVSSATNVAVVDAQNPARLELRDSVLSGPASMSGEMTLLRVDSTAMYVSGPATVLDSQVRGHAASNAQLGFTRLERSTLTRISLSSSGGVVRDVTLDSSDGGIQVDVFERTTIVGVVGPLSLYVYPTSVVDRVTILGATGTSGTILRLIPSSTGVHSIANVEVIGCTSTGPVLDAFVATGVSSGQSLVVRNLVMSGNNAAGPLIQAYTYPANSVSLQNATLANNAVPSALYVQSGSVSLTDSILSANRASGATADVNIEVANTSQTGLTLRNTNVVGGDATILDPGVLINNGTPFDCTAGNAERNQCIGPGFVSGPRGPYYLPAGSPLIDAGSQSAVQAGVNTRTVRTTGVLDTGTVDLGWHYEP